jgi:hypothetical protein
VPQLSGHFLDFLRAISFISFCFSPFLHDSELCLDFYTDFLLRFFEGLGDLDLEISDFLTETSLFERDML